LNTELVCSVFERTGLCVRYRTQAAIFAGGHGQFS
jgi:hypothetical protein